MTRPFLPFRAQLLGLVCLGSALAFIPAARAADAAASRPGADVARDAARKPQEMLAFAKVVPGQTVIDFMPGGGYFTRLFSTAVGPRGAVYAVNPQLLFDKLKDLKMPPPVSGEAGRANVHEAVAHGANLNVPGKIDLFFTAQNYHDVRIWSGAAGTAELNRAVFAALKPGGLYVIVDHAGVPGLDDAAMAKQHRIDVALVKQEVLAAGFVSDGASDVLRNPADPHTANVYDPAIRGKTDQFALRFRKP
jgi:predicted methyltransferase